MKPLILTACYRNLLSIQLAGRTLVTVTRTSSTRPAVPTQLVSLACEVSGEPPGGVYYLWRSTVQERTRVPSPTWDETTATTDKLRGFINIEISENYPPVVRMFCHALANSDNRYLAAGYIDIEVQGTYI